MLERRVCLQQNSWLRVLLCRPGVDDPFDLTISISMVIMIDMITQTTAVRFRQNLGEMLSQVQYRNDSIVISKDGKPVAALVDAELFARIRRMRERFDALSGAVASAYAQVSAEEGMAEIEAAVAAERRG
jgi:prevent-host-death family protein